MLTQEIQDNDLHAQFVYALAMMCAQCYTIPPISMDATRLIVGNITPAVITTTAIVSALSCLNVIQVILLLSCFSW